MQNYRKSISVERQSWVFEWQRIPQDIDIRTQEISLPIKDARTVQHFKDPRYELRVAVDNLGDIWLDKNHPDQFLYKPFLVESLYFLATHNLESFDYFVKIIDPTRLEVIEDAKSIMPILKDTYGINQELLNKIYCKYNWI